MSFCTRSRISGFKYAHLPMRGHLDKIRGLLHMSNSATPVIENSEPNFRKGSEAEIKLGHYQIDA